MGVKFSIKKTISPSTAPFYIVIENTGGEFCDNFDISISAVPI